MTGRMATGGQLLLKSGTIVLIDAEDIALVSHLNWLVHKGYVVAMPRRNGRRETIMLHRLILNAAPDQIIDHADRNPLNNQKANLRFCTQSQNAANRIAPPTESGFRGVRTEKGLCSDIVYRAEILVRGQRKRGPCRPSAKDAAVDYDRLASIFFGAFAVLNFPVHA